MGTRPAWTAARGPPLFQLRTPGADAGPDGLPGRDHPGADQVPAFIRARHARAWSAIADRQPAGEAAVRGCDWRGGISASAQRTHRRCWREAARVIWFKLDASAEGDLEDVVMAAQSATRVMRLRRCPKRNR